MTAFTVTGRLLLDGRLQPGAVVVDGSTIAAVVPESGLSAATLPEPVLAANIVSPGLIDLQINGGFGFDLGDSDEALRVLAARLPATGVTAFLPTLVSRDVAGYRAAREVFATARSARGARALGLHLEGPFINLRRAGAHAHGPIQGATDALIDDFLQGDDIRLVTLAPERPGALAAIARLRAHGIAVSLGHTDATFDQFVAGIDAGATMATHLYNAMSPFQHRAPGAVGAVLADDRIIAGVIADGVHSHFAALNLALKAKGAYGLALVTDAVAAAGCAPGRYRLGAQTIVSDGTAARLEDGTLAGSTLTMDRAVRSMITFAGARAEQALTMATEVPARLLGRTDIGRLTVGAAADLVLWDTSMQVTSTFIAGVAAYQAAGRGQ